MDNDSYSALDGLPEEVQDRIKKAAEIGLEKMRNEGLPFLASLFHPDVLAALKGDTKSEGRKDE